MKEWVTQSGSRWEVFLPGLWREERRWLTLRLLCGLVWAMELFWIQRLGFEATPWTFHPWLYQCIRGWVDLLAALSFSLLLPRLYLVPLLLLNAAALGVVGTYTAYFHRPLMPSAVWYQWREAWQLRAGMHGIVAWPVVVVVGLALVVKLILLARAGSCVVPGWVRWRLAGVAGAAIALPVVALQFTSLKLSPDATNSRAVYAIGYAVPWLFDLVGSSKLADHAERAKPYLARRYDRITPLETPISVKNHVVVVQLESIDVPALEATHQGAPVMPFLRALRNESMFFRINAFHNNGSCDMDFTATTFTQPYPAAVPYRLPGMDYPDSTPAFMKRHGFRTSVLHGNSSHFFDRGGLMERLGFDGVLFKEDLVKRNLRESVIGIRDADLMRCILEEIQSASRTYVFAITLDTHAPFDYLAAGEMELFPRPSNALERYFNSARYLDRCLQELVAGLPGGTTLMVYGDHTPSLKFKTFASDVVAGREFVGCLIYQKGSDLSRLQKTRHQGIATAGELNLLDVLSYLRHCIAAGSPSAAGHQPTKL